MAKPAGGRSWSNGRVSTRGATAEHARAASVASPVQRYLDELYAECAAIRSGVLADYIPELAGADPDLFAIAVATTDGRVYEAGDVRAAFTIQSMSKPFTYGVALEDQGRDAVFEKIGVEPSGEAFNSISLEAGTGRPLNRMINAGAITAASLVAGAGARERFAHLLERYGECAGRELSVEHATFESERATGHRNRAIGHMLRTFGILEDDPEDALDVYFRQCSIGVDCRDVSLMAATLANGGVHPVSSRRALAPRTVETVLSVMTTCGMYDGTGDWVEQVGMPAKSGVSGGILAVLPGQLGVCVYSPPLDTHGNSVRGVEVCRRLARDLHLHFLHVTRPSRSVIRSRHDVASVPSKRTRSEADTAVLRRAGVRALVYELQGDLLFTGVERVVRSIVDRAAVLDAVIVDLRSVSHVSDAAAAMLLDLHDSLARSGRALAIVDHERDGSLAEAGVPRFDDRDAATEWAEDLLLGEQPDRHHPVALADCRLCEGLSRAHLAALGALLEHRVLETGEYVVRAGDHAQEIFILVAGELSVLVDPAEGRHRLATIAPGATFGELAIVGRSARTADVRADRPSEVLALRAADFEALAPTTPELQAALLRNLLRGAYEIVDRGNREVASVVRP